MSLLSPDVPSSGRRLIVEADGGSRGNPGRAAYGALVRDPDTGEVLAVRAERLGIASNNVAEYSGLIAGLEAVREIDPDARVLVRMDSKLVVSQMTGAWKIKHPDMRDLALRARGILPYDHLDFEWIPRASNVDADRLVNQALDGKPIGLAHAPAARAAVEQETKRNILVGWATDNGEPTTVVLLRHGETPLTVSKRFSGRGEDPGLTEAGRAQVRAVAEHLGAWDPSALHRHAPFGRPAAIVSSPLRRARETATAVGDVLGLGVEVAEDLRECDFGEWEAKTYDEVRAGWPDVLDDWLTSTATRPPGGESFDELGERAVAVIDSLVGRFEGQTVLVVAHNMPIKSVVRNVLQAPHDAVFRMELAPGSLSSVQYFSGSGAATLRSFNYTSHLHEAGLTPA